VAPPLQGEETGAEARSALEGPSPDRVPVAPPLQGEGSDEVIAR
jgi:hypothetical protein